MNLLDKLFTWMLEAFWNAVGNTKPEEDLDPDIPPTLPELPQPPTPERTDLPPSQQ